MSHSDTGTSMASFVKLGPAGTLFDDKNHNLWDEKDRVNIVHIFITFRFDHISSLQFQYYEKLLAKNNKFLTQNGPSMALARTGRVW